MFFGALAGMIDFLVSFSLHKIEEGIFNSILEPKYGMKLRVRAA